MESLTYLKNVKMSPKKLRFLLAQIKQHSPVDSLDYLKYTPQKAGKVFYQAIHSAISNAKSALKVGDDMLKFKLLTIEEGQALKRYLPNARGTVRPFKHRFSHIKIILTAAEPIVPSAKKEVTQAEASEKKVEKKAEEISKEKNIKAKVKSEDTPKTKGKK